MAIDKRKRRLKVKNRIRKNLSGTSTVPRVSVFRSNKHIYAQVIDDENGITLASSSTQTKEIAEKINNLNKTEQAKLVGENIASKILAANVSKVVFDRSGYKYHGRIKALADGAREAGLVL